MDTGERVSTRGAARLSHPLLGADLGTLLRTLRRNGPVAPGALPTLTAAVASALARAPLSALERWRTTRRDPAEPPSPGPVVIVGHWRSGTTHVYNVLSQSPAFVHATPISVGLPWNFLYLGRWLRPLLRRAFPEDRFIDRVPVEEDMPQEDEIGLASMQLLSFYHGLYFPRRLRREFRRGIFLEGVSTEEEDRWTRRFRHYHRKHALSAPGRRLLIKNPVYTARAAQIRSVWPEVRFVHVYRNPYRVFVSTRRFYRRLLPQLALQRAEVDVDALVLESYPGMMERWHRCREELPRDRAAEIRFEEFETRPLELLERLYASLELDGFGEARPRFEAYLRSVSDYRKQSYDFSADVVDTVDDRWGEWVERLGYASPPVST